MTLLTDEQRIFVNHVPGVFVEACPGAGKTRAIVARIARIASTLPRRRGLAVLSFTNTAVEEFISRCNPIGLDSALRHPGFVGTFDAFLRQFFFLPGGIDGVNYCPTVVDSWETLGIEIRLRGARAFQGDGVRLDLFDAETNVINLASIRHNGLRAHVQSFQADYQENAEWRRRNLRQHGYISVADVRVDVMRRLQNANWSTAIGQALAARFQEVIVDEAQDCNPLDCQIINWLRGKGIAVTVVADPDQAIYGFRQGGLDEIRALANSYDNDNRLTLTGNFRSSPSICGVAATLRSRATPDVSCGETSAITEPVHVIIYQGNTVTDGIGRKFCELMDTFGIARKDGIVLAHSRKNALRACGSCAMEDAGKSNTAKIAHAVGMFWSSTASNRMREASLRSIERAILDLMGMIGNGEAPSRAAEQHGIDQRWLRRSALDLISQIPRNCADTNEARIAWIAILRQQFRRLNLAYRAGTSECQYFPNRGNADWHRLLMTEDAPMINSATIHEAKGKEYDAVCVVIPPDNYSEQLFSTWQSRTNDEAKRVIYVGFTRAKKFGVISIPNQYRDRMTTILEGAQANWREHNV